MDQWRSVFIHLRLHFQLLLAPVFLWGWLVAGGGFSWSVALAFVAMHVFLYGGVTAFNSFYDRDIGPVGGLEQPPPVVPALLPVSIALQLTGAVLATAINAPFLAVYVLFGLLGLAYSHPRVRLKAHPWPSLLTVGFGQGGLAFFGAWAATRGELASAMSVDGFLGAVAAMLMIVALYPLSQLYQVEEDRDRGDRTSAVAWGPRRCFLLSIGLQVMGGGAMIAVVQRRYGGLDALLVGLALLGQVVAVGWLAGRFDAAQVLANYRRVSLLTQASALLLGGYLAVRLMTR
jgi:4-hydroxybenzoate polyprenyltransferase